MIEYALFENTPYGLLHIQAARGETLPRIGERLLIETQKFWVTDIEHWVHPAERIPPTSVNVIVSKEPT